MTLIEAVLSMLILSIIAAITIPILSSATEAYASAVDVRERVGQASNAMDRIVRMIRETPLDDDIPGELGIASTDLDHIEYIDGRAVRMENDELIMVDAEGHEGLLSDGVTLFEIHLFHSDGVTPAVSTPGRAHVIHVYLEVDGVGLRTVVFPRVRMTERAG
jgi:type II secretory pathway pseudopilin PulG